MKPEIKKKWKGSPAVSRSRANVKTAFNPELNLPHYFFAGILVLIFVIMLITVNPIGNFPLNDDWIYAKPVSSILFQHTYKVFDNIQPVLVFQEYWGALFCLFGGYSFTSLHISAMVMGIAGAIVFYFLLYEFSKNKFISFLAALLLLVNPLYFSLSTSFMTDVPFLTMSLCAIFFFVRFINTNQFKYIILATLFSICATLIRQFGVVFPLAFGLYEALNQKKWINRLMYFIPAVITYFSLEITIAWLTSIDSAPYVLSIFLTFHDTYPTMMSFFTEVLTRCGNVMFYSGLLFLPFLLFLKLPNLKILLPIARYIFIAVVAGISIVFIHFYHEFPVGNYLNSHAVGPKLLDDICLYRMTGNNLDSFSPGALKIIYFFGYIGVILLLIQAAGQLIKLPRYLKKPASLLTGKLFVSLCIAGYFLLFLATAADYDRYMVPLLALICPVLITPPATYRGFFILSALFSVVYLFFILQFSALGTHDYFAWNRARWQAVDYLTKEKNISIHHIDGGMEVNGLLVGQGRKLRTTIPWACVEDNEYMIAFGGVNGFKPIKQFEYQNYYPHATRSIYVLQRDSGTFDPYLHKDGDFFARGMQFYNQKEYEKAIAAWDTTVAINPGNADALNNLGVCYLNYKHDNQKAAQYFEKVVKIKPDYPGECTNLLICAQNSNDIEKMIKYARILVGKGTSIADIKAKGIVITDEMMRKIKEQ